MFRDVDATKESKPTPGGLHTRGSLRPLFDAATTTKYATTRPYDTHTAAGSPVTAVRIPRE